MKHIGTSRRKTRHKLRKSIRDKSKSLINSYFQTFKLDEKVVLKIEPSFHKGMFFPRFHGRTGTITGKSGSCYKVMIKDKEKEKTLIVHPIHLKPIRS